MSKPEPIQLYILLIEDNPGDSRLITEMLHEQDSIAASVIHAERLTEGLAYCASSEVDVILLDLTLPDSTGLDTVSLVSRQNSTIPIIVLTGNASENLGLDALQLGAEDFLVKDEITPYSLVHTIRYAIQRKLTKETQLEAERLRLRLIKEQEQRAMREHFIELASHEFRTPLAAITSSASLLDARLDHMTEEQRKSHLRKIQDASLLITEMLDNILSASLAQSGKMEITPLETDLAAFCHEFLDQFSQAHGSDYNFAFSADGGYSEVPIDTRLFGLILNNLLSNATKYSEPQTTVSVTVLCKQSDIRVQIQDEGTGIPKEDIAFIFDPMYRGSNTNYRPGIGLGLNIAKYAAMLHGGTIEVKSQTGHGSVFTIIIPVTSGLE